MNKKNFARVWNIESQKGIYFEIAADLISMKVLYFETNKHYIFIRLLNQPVSMVILDLN